MFIVIFIAGLSLKIIGIAVLILIPFFGGFFWYIQQDNLPQFLNGYQRQRILGHMYGGGSTQDQQNNSIMAIGSGQLTGKGINSSDVATVKDTNLISEQQTDFIFSAVGEELGFIGSVIIIAILLLIVLQCIRVARRSGDKKGNVYSNRYGSTGQHPVIYQYWCCHIHTSEHGITFAIHKLRTEFTRQFVCRNGHGSQYKFAKEKVLGGFS